MIKLALVGLIVLVVVAAFMIIIRNKPDLWFWIFLNLYFDPGGYVYGFMGGTLLGPLAITDVFLAGMVFCMISANINWKAIFQDQFLTKFVLYLFIFGLYFYIVYGGIVPFLNNDLDYPNFLIKNRLFAYGFIILFAVYAFSLRSLYYFYTATLTVGAICLTLYLITLFTGVGLIPVEKFSRYTGGEMVRVSMVSYGIFYLLFPVSLITYLLSKKIKLNIKYKNWLYYSGIVMILTMIITLTRRIQINIFGTAVISTVIIANLFRTGKLIGVLRLLAPAVLVILVLSFTFPDYTGYLAEIGEDTFLLMTTGKDSKGNTDQRVSGSNDYVLVEQYISNNLFLGTGYTYLFWKDGRATSSRGLAFAVATDAAGEVPIYYLLFGYGLIGALLMLPLYFMMLKLFFNLAKLLKITFINYLQNPLIIIISIYILLSIAIKFTISFYNLSLDFNAPNMGFTTLLMGMGLALYRKIYLENQSQTE